MRLATRAAVRSAGGRLQPAKQLHITLAFLGAVPATQLDDTISAARSLSGVCEDLVFDQLSYWPKPKVYCAIPSQAPKKIIALRAKLEAALRMIGGTNPGHKFRPHVTLCRGVQRAPPVTQLPPVSWPVRDFVLVESRLGTREYVVLQRFS